MSNEDIYTKLANNLVRMCRQLEAEKQQLESDKAELLQCMSGAMQDIDNGEHGFASYRLHTFIQKHAAK